MEDNLPIKELHYNNIIKPLLNSPANSYNLMYFYDQAFRFWILGLKKEDIQEVIRVENICKKFLEKDKDLVVVILNEVYDKIHDYRSNLERLRDNYNKKLDEEVDNDLKFQAGFEYYKSFFENEFNLWISPIVAFLLNHFPLDSNIKKRYKKVSNYVTLGSSAKFSILSKSGILPLSSRIETMIRNAGAGHDSWDMQDNGTCKLDDINPNTGEIKSSIIISLDDLVKKIKLMEKFCFILDLGIQIFIHNADLNDDVIIKPGREVKIKEIERLLNVYAKEYQLKVNKFNFGIDRKKLDFEIEKIYKTPSVSPGSVYTDHGVNDVVEIKKEVKYIDQVFGLIFHILHLNNNNSFDLSLCIKDHSSDIIYSGDFSSDELSKILLSTQEKVYPKPNMGDLPEDKYILISEKLVPQGLGKDIQYVCNDNPLFTQEYKDFIMDNIRS